MEGSIRTRTTTTLITTTGMPRKDTGEHSQPALR
jgi:hypothetical protein